MNQPAEPIPARLAAPAEHGGKLLLPPADQLALSARANALAHSSGTAAPVFCGLGLADLRAAARASAVTRARQYVGGYGSPPKGMTSVNDQLLFMGGHQPELFHCGVWYKNFVLSALAAAHGGIALHFIVDNDLCRSTSIKVPTRLDNRWAVSQVPFDRLDGVKPWENCGLIDLQLWDSFTERVRSLLPPDATEPLLGQLWNHARRLAREQRPLGQLLSQARHLLEADLGLHTLEIPLSSLVETSEFARFSLQLLSDLPRLHQVYNQQLQVYRQAHRIRNRAQPLPPLAADDQWLETPWWCYHRQSHQRQPLWVQPSSQGLRLSDRDHWHMTIEAPAESDAAVEQWLAIQRTGVRLRPRALLTTMYARLILADLFVHGIGGARYDQITDGIISHYFNIAPPRVAIASATLQLPWAVGATEPPQESLEAVAYWGESLRTARNNPAQALARTIHQLDDRTRSQVEALLDERQALLENVPRRGEKWQWHHAMKRLTEQLGQMAQPLVQQAESELAELRQRDDQWAIAAARDYSFCLFPQSTIEGCFAQPLAT